VLFVIGHMIGNMTVFFGPDTINAYAMHLRDLGPLLWLIRLFMLTSVVLHIWFTMLVWKENVEAHPQKYAVFAPMKTTIFARTMPHRSDPPGFLCPSGLPLLTIPATLITTDLHGRARCLPNGHCRFRNPRSAFSTSWPWRFWHSIESRSRELVPDLGRHGPEMRLITRLEANPGLDPLRRYVAIPVSILVLAWQRSCK
jgi:hypothetical protein